MTTKTRKPLCKHANPVARAVAKAKAEKEAKRASEAKTQMREHLTKISIEAYMTIDGERADVLMSDLALMLGIGAEIGFHLDKHAPNTRKMHAALRTVVAMSANGRRWQTSQTVVLHEAAMLAATAFEENIVLGITMLPGAAELAEEVKNGTANLNGVAGPEIYNAVRAA